jgi:hypothetical protein
MTRIMNLNPDRKRTPVGRFAAMLVMVALALLALALQAGLIQGQEESEAAPITAASILDRFVAVTGGAEAYARLETRISKGTVLTSSMDDMSLLTVYETTSTSRYQLLRSEAQGEREEGSIGETAWTCSLMGGPRVMKGKELAHALGTAPLDAPARWRELLASAEYAGTRELDGKTCHVVKVEPHGCGEETRFYEEDSGLLVRIELTLFMEGSELPGVITFGDYRAADGILVPHTIKRDHASLDETVITIDEIDHRTPIPSSVFLPPAEIMELMER